MYIRMLYVGMGRKRSSGARFNLGPPWDGKLADFCEANLDSSATSAVRAALDLFIDHHLANNPGVKAKYDELRKMRGEIERGHLVLLQGEKP